MAKIRQFKHDDCNPNKGTDKGRELMKTSLSELGAGRSILVDKDNNIIAGNKTLDAALAAGLEDAIVVETTGDVLVAVKRTDIDINTKKGRELALADNSTQQESFAWDEASLMRMNDEYNIDFQEWKVPIAKPYQGGGTNGVTGSHEEQVIKKELRIKFTPDEYNYVLSKLREHSDIFEEALLDILGIA